MAIQKHVMVIQASKEADFCGKMYEGVCAVLEDQGFTHDLVKVPGIMEIPPAIAIADKYNAAFYDAYIPLGCMVNDGSYLFKVVCEESAAWIMNLAVQRSIPIGNGILPVQNPEEGEARAEKTRGDAGGEAAKTALHMLKVKLKLFNYEENRARKP